MAKVQNIIVMTNDFGKLVFERLTRSGDRRPLSYDLITTPGVGFGPSGEGYVRLTAFGKREDCEEAMRRFQTLKK